MRAAFALSVALVSTLASAGRIVSRKNGVRDNLKASAAVPLAGAAISYRKLSLAPLFDPGKRSQCMGKSYDAWFDQCVMYSGQTSPPR